MQLKSDNALTRRELIQRSGMAAGALLLPHRTDALEQNASAAAGTPGSDPADAPLPNGVKAVWDRKHAYAEKTPTRERVCLNGLWRWQPAREAADTAPVGAWGYFKVPGSWPGITDYMHKDCQTVYSHPDWKNEKLGGVTEAWYQREIAVPGDWAGRRIAVSAEYLNSLATVYVDGKRVGEMRFPGGEVDLTAVCRPGATHLLSMRVAALPLRAVMLSYTDTASARQVRGTVERRGLCGDVKVDTSVRRGEITFDTALEGLAPGASYALRIQVREKDRTVREFMSRPFQAGDLRDGRIAFTEKWKPGRLWDLNTPENIYTVQVALLEPGGRLLDAAQPARFGFREFRIQGRDFYLNGSRIFLSAVPLDNAQVGAAWATYAGARESLERLQSFGINFVYTHNYGCEPGAHLSFAEILKAADDVGMLVALSQPHFSHYEWRAPDADRNNGYARHAEFYVRAAQNHPSVVAYAMSHNATSYVEDMNPDMIDGIRDPREPYALNNARLALRAEAIVKRLDPNRIVYHHSSGNLGAMHTSNFYVNFTPIQELSDWFEHWATQGVKPVFLCEYGVPFSWDWTMYRGWYHGKREWGSAVVPWEFCLAEWDAQFFGDRAYRISDREKANLRWEAAQFRAGRVWHRWDYPTTVGSGAFEERNPVFADYITDNWRAYRTWGVSAFSPWEHAMYWLLRDGVDKSRKALPVDWERLQRPGFSPDYLEERPEDRVVAFDRADWIPTAAAQAVIRNNRPLLAYIGGKPARFTSKDHNFLPGETVEKQLILLNNSRTVVSCDCRWSFDRKPPLPPPEKQGGRGDEGLPRTITGSKTVRIPTGEQARVPLRFPLPTGLAAGPYELAATVRFSTGETQRDAFAVHVLPPPPSPRTNAKIALFDPNGETARLLGALGVPYRSVDAMADLSPYDVLIVGKGALTREGPGPDVRRVREGLKVVVLEQTAEALEQRFGFRVAEYGLRQVFRRMADHPLLAGLEAESLRDWRGEATLLPPRLKYVVGQRYAPMVKWCGIDVTRVWRCGCRGNVASVLIEKPARGDFLPVLDGGYSLQYSPLLEYREGQGMVLFCQMDVTGRTETDPAAERMARNIVGYACAWKPSPRREALYVGDPAGRVHLEAAGFAPGAYANGKLPANAVLIVGPGGGRQLAGREADVRAWLQAGGRLLAIGLDEAEANGFLPVKVQMKRGEHIAAYFDPPAADSWLAGIGPADVHNRDPRDIPLVSGGAAIVGDGVLARAENANVVFSQLVPWQFDPKQQKNLKRTFRRVANLTTRLAANLGVPSTTPLLTRFRAPVDPAGAEKRWLDGLYLDTPEEWDDPYRFFGW
jgi:beta-galactosidase